MIAFLVWNNHQIINSVNLKVNYDAEIPADLYIRANSVSAAMVEKDSKF